MLYCAGIVACWRRGIDLVVGVEVQSRVGGAGGGIIHILAVSLVPRQDCFIDGHYDNTNSWCACPRDSLPSKLGQTGEATIKSSASSNVIDHESVIDMATSTSLFYGLFLGIVEESNYAAGIDFFYLRLIFMINSHSDFVLSISSNIEDQSMKPMGLFV